MANAPVVLPIELSPAQIRPMAYRIFSKRHGLNLKSPALTVLARFVGHHFGADWRTSLAEKSLDEIARRWKNEERGIFVDNPEISQVVKEWISAQAVGASSSGAGEKKFDWRQYFRVVSATNQRRIVYEAAKKNFALGSDSRPELFGNAASLTHVFGARYEILLDKLYRSEKFQPPGLTNQFAGSTSHVLTPIKNLLGKNATDAFYLFGLLQKQTDGPWTLYDPTGSIQLEFGDYSRFFPDHYYTAGSFLICHGQLSNSSTFMVTMMGPPPVETREQAKEAYGHVDFYGLLGPKASQRLERMDPNLNGMMVREEQEMYGNRVVLLGADIFLDVDPVVEALRKVFHQLESDPPLALVMCGSFLSQPFDPHLKAQDGRSPAQIYRDAMNNLADILGQCPKLAANTKLVLVPGPNDPWQSMSVSVLPFHPLPSVFTGRISHAASDVVFASNPCRLCYLSQEILIFRSNSGRALRANSLDTTVFSQLTAGDNTLIDNTLIDNTLIDNTFIDNEQATLTAAEKLTLDDEDSERLADRAAVQAMMAAPKHLNLSTSVSNDHQESRAVMATLLDQCHLSPLSLATAPVIWEFDHALSMAQWPTALALCDPTSPRGKQTYHDCDLINSGLFYQNGMANWLEYWPSTQRSKFVETM